MKKIVVIFLIIISFWLGLFGIDFILSLNNHKPLIILKESSYNNIKEYISLGYKVVEYDINNTTSFKIHLLFYKINDFKLIEPDNCNEGKTIFYKDNNYEYYFYCNKTVYVDIDGEDIEISSAIENNIITIDDLNDLGLVFGKEAINSYTLDIKESNDCNYLLGDSSELKKITDNIYYYCLNSAYMYVNSDYMELSEALQKYDFETIVYGMTKKREYTSGAIMYSQDNSNILKCSNGKIIVGSSKLENFDFLCD